MGFLKKKLGYLKERKIKRSILKAIKNNDIESIKNIFNKYDNIIDSNFLNRDFKGRNLLISAIGDTENSLKIIKKILEKNPDINILDKNGNSPLMIASLVEDPEIVKELINKGADVNLKNSKGLTALMVASMVGHSNVAKILINHGANVNVKSMDGTTILMQGAGAQKKEDPDIVEVLLDAGADVNVKANNGKTALMVARFMNANQRIRLLINAGAR